MKMNAAQKRRLALAFMAFSVTVVLLMLGIAGFVYMRVMGAAGYSREIARHLPDDVYAMVALRNPSSLAIFLTRTELLDAWEDESERSNADETLLREILSQQTWTGFNVTSPLGCGLRLDEAYAVMGCTAAVADGDEAVRTLEDVAEELTGEAWRPNQLGEYEARVSEAGTIGVTVVSDRLYLIAVQATITEEDALHAMEQMLEDMVEASEGASLANVSGFNDAMDMARYTVAAMWISGAVIREAQEQTGWENGQLLEDLSALGLGLGYEDDTVELSGRAVFDSRTVDQLDFGSRRSTAVFRRISEPAVMVAHVAVNPVGAWDALEWLSRADRSRRSELEDFKEEIEDTFDMPWDDILDTWTGELGVVVQKLTLSVLWREVESWTVFLGVSSDEAGSALLQNLLDGAEDNGMEVEEEEHDGHAYLRLTEVSGRERFAAVSARRIWLSNDEGTLREVVADDVRAPLLSADHNVGLNWALNRSVPGVVWLNADVLEGLPIPGMVGRWRDAIHDGLDSASIAIETEPNLFHFTVQLHARNGDIANIGELAAPR
jgi:hypothetical protein